MVKFIEKNGVIVCADVSKIDEIVGKMSGAFDYMVEFTDEIVDKVTLGVSGTGNTTITMKMQSGFTAKTHTGAVMFAKYPNFEDRKAALINGFDVVGELEGSKISRTKTTMTIESSGATAETPEQKEMRELQEKMAKLQAK